MYRTTNRHTWDAALLPQNVRNEQCETEHVPDLGTALKSFVATIRQTVSQPNPYTQRTLRPI